VTAFYFAKSHSFFREETILRFLRLTDKTNQAHLYAFYPLGSFGERVFVRVPSVEEGLARGLLFAFKVPVVVKEVG